jgi:hypothetical protein
MNSTYEPWTYGIDLYKNCHPERYDQFIFFSMDIKVSISLWLLPIPGFIAFLKNESYKEGRKEGRKKRNKSLRQFERGKTYN